MKKQKTYWLQFTTNFGGFEKGDIIIAKRGNNGDYHHIFWTIPSSVVKEINEEDIKSKH